MRWIYRGALLGALALGLLPCGPAAAQAPGGPLLRGDVNADGSVTAVDALAVLSHVVGKTLPAGFTVSPNGDADGNGEVTALDALIMLSYVVGKDVSRYPVGKPLVDVAVTPPTATVPVGGNFQLRARVSGGVADSAVIWRSDAPSVAAVSASGIVTGIAPGSASVTALSRADTTRRATAAVTVTGVAAATISVSPDTATLAVGATRQLTATVRDGAGNPIPTPAVTWASSDTGVARVSATGLATAVAPGVASVTATSGGRSGGATLTVRTASLVPAGYAVGTSTPDPVAGSTATLQAQLVDSAGVAIATAGKTVTWSSTGGGTFASPTSTTNAAGVATVTFTVSTTAGTVHRVTATDADGLTGTSGDLRVQVGGAGTVQVLAGDSQSVIVGLPVPVAPRVRVVDGSGNGVPEVPVTFAVAAGGGTLTGAVQTTNAAGEATLGSWTLGLVAGPNTLTASAPGATPATFTATGLVGSPTDIAKVSGDGGTSAAGTTRTLVARVTDAGGNGVPGETVTWTVSAGGGSVAAATSVTDATGTAGIVWTLGTGVGAQTLTAARAGLTGSPLTYSVTTVPGAVSLATSTLTPSAASITANGTSTSTLTVQLKDALGNALTASAGTVALSATGTGTLSAVTDNGNGSYTATLTAPTVAGVAVVTGTLDGSPLTATATVTFAPGVATKYLVTSSADSVVAGSPVTITARLADAFDNAVPTAGRTVTWSANGGSFASPTSTTDAGGVATVVFTTSTTAGATHAVTADDGTVSGTSGSVVTTVGPASLTASTLTASQASITADGTSTSIITVQLRDANGNNRPASGGTVVLASSGGGTLSGVTDNGNGSYTATLTAPTTVGSTTISGTLAGSPLTATATVTFAPGVATKYIVTTSADSLVAGGAVTVTAQLADANDNAVPTAGQTVTWSQTGAGGSFASPTSATSASGVATVAFTTSTTSSVTYTFTANDGTVSGTSGNVVTRVGPVSLTASTLTASQASITADGTSTSVITVQLKDANGNNQPASGGTVVLGSSGGGTLSSVTDSGNGSYTATLTAPTTVGSTTISGTLNGTPLTATATVAFVPGAPTKYIVTTSTDSLVAGSTVTVTAQLADAFNNAVPTAGRTVTWSQSGAGGSFASPTSATNASGVATTVFTTSTVSGVTYTFMANDGTVSGTSGSVVTRVGAVSLTTSTLTASQASITANGTSTSVVTVQLKDANGNNQPASGGTVVLGSSGGGTLSSVTDNGNGSYTATLTAPTTTGSTTISGTLNGSALTATATVTFAPGAATKYIVTTSADSVVAGSTVTVTAQLADAFNNAVPTAGQTVTWSQTGAGGSFASPTSATNASGVATVVFTTSTVSGVTYTFTANDGTVSGTSGSVVTRVGAVSLTTSTLTASQASITANGTSTSVLTVQLKDANGNNLPASGGTVALSATGGTLSGVTDNGNGSYTATLTAPTTTGSATISGTLNGSALTATATVAFVPGAATKYIVTTSADSVVAGSPVTVTAQLADTFNNVVPTAGRTVAWSSTGGGSFASPSTPTDGSGIATVVFTTSSSADSTHVVTANDGTVSGASGGVVTRVGTPVNIAKLDGDGASLAAGSAVTPPPSVRITDANGNGVPGITVVFAVTAGGGTITGETPATNSAGIAALGSWTLGITAGTNTLSVAAGSLSTTFSATGTVGPASTAATQITTSNAALTSGSITTVTVQVKDQHGNDLTTGGATVVLSTDLGTLGTVTDVGNGTYTADLTHAGTDGTATVTGTLGGAAITDNAQVTFTAGGIQRTWTGLGGSDWTTAGSWDPRGTPTTSDTIVINSGGTQPQVTDADKTILRLVMGSGGTLDLNARKLTVTADAAASGGTVSDGTVVMSGASRTIQGTFPNLLITGGISTGGSTRATGNVTVSSGTLTVANQTLTISGS